jgi:hydroxymethylbilane synthase
MNIKTGARSSPLSKVQFEEVAGELRAHHPEIILEPIWALSPGDKDKETSLRSLGKCDFFTRDLDEMLLNGKIRIAVHSAKDLPEPLTRGLQVVAITKGLDPRDSLVTRDGETLQSGFRIATSSQRREEAVNKLCEGLLFSDLRGRVGERLARLERGEVDGVVVAEAALIRLKLTHLNRVFLEGAVPLQGRLAVVAREGDAEMKRVFQCLSST